VNAEKMAAPSAKRTDEYESGCQPCVSAYLTTVKLKLQRTTVARSRRSAGTRWRTGARYPAGAAVTGRR
jgi:hypothetical protein